MAEYYCSKCTTKCQPSAIRQLNAELVGLLQYEIDVILSQAFSLNLIGKQTKNSSKTDEEKATLLLNVITERVKTDPGTFDKFLDLLRGSVSLEHLAKCLEDKVREIHQPNGDQQTPRRGDSGSSQQAAQLTSNSPHTDDEADHEGAGHCNQPNRDQPQYQTRRKRSKKSHNSKDSKAATCKGQSKLPGETMDTDESDTEYESGVATASELVPGDVLSGDESPIKLDAAESFPDGDPHPQVQPQAPSFVLGMANDQHNCESTAGESVPIPFAVQVQSADQIDLIGECDQQPVPHHTHVQTSEQAQYGASTLVHGGTTSAEANENDWANKARYYVAVGAARETEKDKEIEELNQEKTKLEKELKDKERKHAETIKRETEEHLKQVAELKHQLAEKENDLNTLQEKRTTEIEKTEKKFNQEIENLKKQNSELEQKIAEKTKAVQTLSDEVKVKTQELEKLRMTTQEKIEELEASLTAKQKQIEEFEAKKAIEISAIEEKFNGQISKLEKELECEKKAAKVREKLLESESRVKFLEEEKKYIAEANDLKLKIKALETKLAEEKALSANKESEHLKAQNEQLTLKHAQSEARLQKMEKQIQEKDEQLVQCMNELKRLSLSSSSSEASLNVTKNSISGDSFQLQPVNEVVKFRFQESPDEFT